MNEPNASWEAPQGPQIGRSNKKTKRYSKRSIATFVLLLGVLIAAITTQAQFKPDGSGATAPEKNYRSPRQADFAELAASMRRDRRPVQIIESAPAPAVEKKTQAVVIKEGRRPQSVLPRYYSNQDDAQAAQTLRTLRLQALTAKPVVEDFVTATTGVGATTQNASPETRQGVMASRGSGMVMDSAAMAAMLQPPAGNQDPNGQQRKQSFLRGSGGGGSLTPQGYSQNLPVPCQFPYELKAGTIIPGLLLTGINSDLPGNVLAQVSENIWDVTGKHVLIPKGTRVIGAYDSQVTFGQQRVLLLWNRLVFPDGMTLDIAGSPGVDMAGYSGLSGRVNEHWGRMFKAALLSSVFMAGAEIIYSEDSDRDSDKKSPSDVAAESLAGSILDMGTKVMNRATDVQPTITVLPGKKMGIFVQQDIVFPFPYF